MHGGVEEARGVEDGDGRVVESQMAADGGGGVLFVGRSDGVGLCFDDALDALDGERELFVAAQGEDEAGRRRDF